MKATDALEVVVGKTGNERLRTLFAADPAGWGPKLVHLARTLPAHEVRPIAAGPSRWAPENPPPPHPSPPPAPAIRPRPSLALHVRGYLCPWQGLGQIAEHVGRGLEKAVPGLSVTWASLHPDRPEIPREAPAPPGANVLQVVVPETEPIAGHATTSLAMWESSRIGPKAAECLNRSSLVVTPCTFNERVFRESGVTVPIRVVPMGVDPGIFFDDGAWPDGMFIFGVAGRLKHGGLRKNLSWAAQQFVRVADLMPNARMVVKATPGDDVSGVPCHPRITVDTGRLDLPGMAAWLRSIHCYINSARGEGWGLIGAESLAVGRPMIAAPWSATVDFWSAPEMGWSVDYSLAPAIDENLRFYADQGALWAVPDADSFVAALLAAYRDRDECRRRGRAGARRMLGFSWARTVAGVRAALEEFGFLPRPEPELPPLASRAANYARAQVRHTLDGRAKADDATVAARLAICGGCDRLRASDRRCAECGCPVEAKAAWRSEACPLGKWGATDERQGCGCRPAP
jgi:glycosyltransferase involved in cell wall biosynthesis